MKAPNSGGPKGAGRGENTEGTSEQLRRDPATRRAGYAAAPCTHSAAPPVGAGRQAPNTSSVPV
jgi:hypothetical protein